jgi:putative transposon-encoded protein
MKHITKELIKEAEFDSIVRGFTSGGYIPVSKKYVGRRAHVIILPDDDDDKKTKN